MYANRDSAAPVRPQRGLGGLPILALCCLLFILFLIAATIVLALIPVYIRSKDVTPVTTRSFRATVPISTSLPDGNLDDASLRNLANGVANAKGINPAAVTPSSGSGSISSGKRKRREFLLRSERQVAKTLTFIYIINLLLCSPSCTSAISVASFTITITQITLTVGGLSQTFTSIFLTIVAISNSAVTTQSTTVSTGTSESYYGRAPVPSTVPDGSVDATTRASIGSAFGTKLASNSQAVTVTSGIVSSNSRHKRELLQRSQRQTVKYLFIIFVFNSAFCSGTQCSITSTTTVDIGTITLVLGGVVYLVSLIFTIFPLATVVTAGPTVATTTTTVASVTGAINQG